MDTHGLKRDRAHSDEPDGSGAGQPRGLGGARTGIGSLHAVLIVVATVWVLMACLGGFEVLGTVGLVVGPVLLALTRELWVGRLRALAAAETGASLSLAGDRSN